MNETDGEPWLSGLRMRDDAIAVNRPCPQNLMGLEVRFVPNRWLTTELSGDSAELAKLAQGFVADLAVKRVPELELGSIDHWHHTGCPPS